MKKTLSEIIEDFLIETGCKAAFLFSVDGTEFTLLEYFTTEKELLKDYSLQKNKKITETYLQNPNGFYSGTYYLNPYVKSSKDTSLMLHIFPAAEGSEVNGIDEQLDKLVEQIKIIVSLEKFSSKMRYAELLDFPLIVKDFKGNIKYCNSETFKQFVSDIFDLENINGVYSDYFEIQSDEILIRHTDEAISKGASEILLNRMVSGRTTTYKMVSKLIKEENLLLDIITRIDTEVEVRDDFSRKFQELVEAYEGLAFFLDKNGYFQVINSSGAHLLGFKSQEVIGKHFLEFVCDEYKAEIALTFQNILTSRKNMPFETMLKDSLDNKISFQVFGSAVYSENKVSGFLGFARDLTELKKLEEKISYLDSRLIEANRLISIEKDRAQEQINVLEEINKLKNEFISNVSHELRTPLASIVGFAETITSDTSLPNDMVMEFTNIILSEGKRLAKLINDILDFSKLENLENALNTELFDLIPLVREVINGYKNVILKKNLVLNTEIPEAEISIIADREKLKKVFDIIFSNALKYSCSDGRVTVIVKDFLKEVEIIFVDTGTGIAEKDLPKLFQKFNKLSSTEENQGPGFGLVTAKQIIDMHKGIIRVKSEVKKGSTFIIRLPKK